MGRAINRYLLEYGGKEMYTYGEGDDDGSLEEDFDNWKSGFWPAMLTLYHPLHKGGHNSDGLGGNGIIDVPVYNKVELTFDIEYLEPKHSTRTITMNPVHPSPASQVSKAMPSTRHYFTAVEVRIMTNRELRNINNNQTEEKIGSTRHIELDLSTTTTPTTNSNGSTHTNGTASNNSTSILKYNTADNLAIIPYNLTTAVESLALQQGYNLDLNFKFIPPKDTSTTTNGSDIKLLFPTPCTIREALSLYVDIHGQPKHATLTYLVPYVEDETQKAW